MGEEFPRQAVEWVDAVGGVAFEGDGALRWRWPVGCASSRMSRSYPYVKQPEDLVLGKPMYFAAAYPVPDGAIPVLVKSDAFRPIKVDGNPDHPMSKGKSDALTQATLLDMYDPDRSQHVVYRGRVYFVGKSSREEFAAAAKKTQVRAGASTSCSRDDYLADACRAVEAGSRQRIRRRSWCSGSR